MKRKDANNKDANTETLELNKLKQLSKELDQQIKELKQQYHDLRQELQEPSYEKAKRYFYGVTYTKKNN